MLSVKDVAEMVGITTMQVNNYCTTNRLFRYANGPNKSRIPTDHAGNREFLLDRIGYQPPELKGGPRLRVGAPPIEAQLSRVMKYPLTAPPPPPSDRMPSAEQYGPGEDMLRLEEVLEAVQSLDLTRLSAAAVQKVARLETALKTRADREYKRGQLIDRALVSTVFNRLYQIDSNELKTIGAKVAPDVGAEFGVEDTETLLRIEKRIEDEILRVLAHIKQVMDDFLRGVGAETIEET